MHATEVKPGDQFVVDGEVVYVVEEVSQSYGDIRLLVRYQQDGGQGHRVFNRLSDVPLVRP